MPGQRIERADLADRVLCLVRAVVAVQAFTTAGPSPLGLVLPEAERVTRDAAEAFVGLAGLLYPAGPGSACPSGEGWAFLDALRAAMRDGADSGAGRLRAA